VWREDDYVTVVKVVSKTDSWNKIRHETRILPDDIGRSVKASPVVWRGLVLAARFRVSCGSSFRLSSSSGLYGSFCSSFHSPPMMPVSVDLAKTKTPK